MRYPERCRGLAQETVLPVTPVNANCSNAPGCPPPLVDDKAAPKKSAGYRINFIDINRASYAALAEIPSLGKANADFLIVMRQKAPFRDAADLASRVCSQASVNLEQTSIRVGSQEILYRGVDPKSPGWKCGPAPGAYSYGNKSYKF